jgi:hypothetical protein
MKSEKEIVDLLTEIFSSVSCSNCSSYPLYEEDKNYKCATCQRKSMMWGLAEGSARLIAQEILE